MKKLLSIALCLLMILTLVSCGGKSTEVQPPGDAADEQTSQNVGGKTDGFKVAYSIGYVGNAWRSQLVSSLEEAAADDVADGTMAEFQVVSADNDSTTQISQCNAMLAEGLDPMLTVLSHNEVLEMYTDQENNYAPDKPISRKEAIDAWFNEK